MQNNIVLPSGVSAPVHVILPSSGGLFFVSLVVQISYSAILKQIFTNNAYNDVVPVKDVPFGGHDD